MEIATCNTDQIRHNGKQSYLTVRSALLRYQAIHGDMLVTQSFTVPVDDVNWPQKAWGMKLGQVVNSIRSRNSHKDHFEDLEAVGFDFGRQRVAHGYAVVKLALLQYKVMHGDMLVPQSFIVPDDVKWPEVTRGMKLGHAVSQIRCRNNYKDQWENLESIGFDFSPQRLEHGYDIVKTALLAYKVVYGNMRVPQSFVIPADNVTWPKVTWGIKLGVIVMSIRRGDSYSDQREELKCAGFDYGPLRLGRSYATVKLALLRYQEIYGDMLVPRTFVVQADDVLWPEETRRMKLGSIVHNMRCGLTFKKKRDELALLGFNYGSEV